MNNDVKKALILEAIQAISDGQKHIKAGDFSKALKETTGSGSGQKVGAGFVGSGPQRRIAVWAPCVA